MSNIRALFEKAVTDDSLQAPLEGLSSLSPEDTRVQLIAIAEEYELPVTEAEIDTFKTEVNGQLSEADLEAVAGGAQIVDVVSDRGQNVEGVRSPFQQSFPTPDKLIKAFFGW